MIKSSIKDIFAKTYRKDILQSIIQPIDLGITETINDTPSTWEGTFKRYVDIEKFYDVIYSYTGQWQEGTFINTELSGDNNNLIALSSSLTGEWISNIIDTGKEGNLINKGSQLSFTEYKPTLGFHSETSGDMIEPIKIVVQTNTTSGDFAYIGDNVNGNLYVYNIADKSNPVLVNTHNIAGATELIPKNHPTNGRLIVIDNNNNAIRLLDISNPLSITEVDNDTTDLSSPVDAKIIISGVYTYTVVCSSGNNKAVVFLTGTSISHYYTINLIESPNRISTAYPDSSSSPGNIYITTASYIIRINISFSVTYNYPISGATAISGITANSSGRDYIIASFTGENKLKCYSFSISTPSDTPILAWELNHLCPDIYTGGYGFATLTRRMVVPDAVYGIYFYNINISGTAPTLIGHYNNRINLVNSLFGAYMHVATSGFKITDTFIEVIDMGSIGLNPRMIILNGSPATMIVGIQTRTGISESSIVDEEWGANVNGSFVSGAYYTTGTNILSDPNALGKRYIQTRLFLSTTKSSWQPQLWNLYLNSLSSYNESVDILDKIEVLDDIEIIVDGDKIFSGTIEDVAPDYADKEIVSLSGYSSIIEIQNRVVRWQYNNYIHDIVRDLLNRYNNGGKIQIVSTNTACNMSNGSKTVNNFPSLDLTTLVNPKWIRLLQNPSGTEYKYYKIDTIVSSGELLLEREYDGSAGTTNNAIIDDLDCDDFTDAGLVYAQFTNESITGALSYLAPLGVALFWVDKDYKLHFKTQDVTQTPNHTFFKDYNIKVLQLKETGREIKNRGFLYGGVFNENFNVNSITPTTITDNSKSWTTDLYKGYTITVSYDSSSGDEYGKVYHILGNTSNTLDIGTHTISSGDYVTISGRVFEIIQNTKSIQDTGKIREFIVNDTSVVNPSYAKFVLLKTIDLYKDSEKEGTLILPFGDLTLQLGDIVDLRGFIDTGSDIRTYWNSGNWDEIYWSTESFDIFRFYLTKFSHRIDENGLSTSIEISKTLPTLEDMLKDIDARLRNEEQTTEDMPFYSSIGDFINPIDDSKPYGYKIGDTFENGLELTSSIEGIIRWV